MSVGLKANVHCHWDVRRAFLRSCTMTPKGTKNSRGQDIAADASVNESRNGDVGRCVDTICINRAGNIARFAVFRLLLRQPRWSLCVLGLCEIES